jgi:hypothetical protein
MSQIFSTIQQRSSLLAIQNLGSKQASITNPHKPSELNFSNIQRQAGSHKLLPQSLSTASSEASENNRIVTTILFVQLPQFYTNHFP